MEVYGASRRYFKRTIPKQFDHSARLRASQEIKSHTGWKLALRSTAASVIFAPSCMSRSPRIFRTLNIAASGSKHRAAMSSNRQEIVGVPSPSIATAASQLVAISSRIPAILAAASLAYAFFFGLGSYGLLDNNEGLYAEAAREMLSLHDYIIPHVDFVPYIEKPPLLYWLVALSFEIFGRNEFAARLVPSAAAAMSCVVAFWLAHREKKSTRGYIALVIMASSIVFIAIGRTVFFESLLTLTTSAGLACLYFYLTRHEPFYLRVGYVWLALGVLTKGLVALALPALVIVAFLAVTRAPLRRYAGFFSDLPALAAFAAVAVPWHIAASLRDPHFAWFYFINEHVNRFLGEREPHDYYGGPVWYYVPRLFAYFAPWSVLLPPSLLAAWRNHTDFDRFLVVWLSVVFLFFSLSSDKANYYVAIAAVPASLIIGRRVEQWLENGRIAPLLLIGSVWAVLVLAGLLVVQSRCTPEMAQLHPACLSADNVAITAVLTYLIMLATFAGFGIRQLPGRQLNILSLAVVPSFIVPTLFIANNAIVRAEDAVSERGIMQTIESAPGSRAIYYGGKYEDVSSLLFYMKTPLHIIDFNHDNADLAYGKSHARPGWFVSLPQFRNDATRQPLYLILKRRTAPLFMAEYGADHLCTVRQNPHILLLSNVTNDCARH